MALVLVGIGVYQVSKESKAYPKWMKSLMRDGNGN